MRQRARSRVARPVVPAILQRTPEAGGNSALQVKTQENDGYSGVQVGFCSQKPQRVPLWDVKFESLADGNHAVIAQISVDSTPLFVLLL
jgi:hypothetical protein